MKNKVLTIAGSDSSGGAGIQADIKTFSAHRLIGLSVITSVTSQNSSGVRSRHDLPSEVIEDQLRAALVDGRPAAVKTGMLGNENIVEAVARILKRISGPNLRHGFVAIGPDCLVHSVERDLSIIYACLHGIPPVDILPPGIFQIKQT